MLKKLKQRLASVSEPNIPDNVVPMFRQLVSFIDSGLAQSYQKEGDERAEQLVTHMLHLRDFMTRQVTENGMRQVLMKEINAIIAELEEESVVDVAPLESSGSLGQAEVPVEKKDPLASSIETS